MNISLVLVICFPINVKFYHHSRKSPLQSTTEIFFVYSEEMWELYTYITSQNIIYFIVFVNTSYFKEYMIKFYKIQSDNFAFLNSMIYSITCEHTIHKIKLVN